MTNKLKRFSFYIAVVIPLVFVTACNHDKECVHDAGTEWDGGCFTVTKFDSPNPPAPHLDVGDRFHIYEEGGKWWLEPGTGMSNWEKIGGSGGTPIEMKFIIKNPNSILWAVDADITDHPSAAPHGREHKNGMAFRFTVKHYDDPASTTVEIKGAAGRLGGAHGGSAHANLN